MAESEQEIKKLLSLTIEKRASDLHLSANAPAVFRIHGQLQNYSEGIAVYPPEKIEEMATYLMRPEQKKMFEEVHTLDMAITYNKERFRINVYRERGHAALAIRRLDSRIRSLKELNLPEQLERLAKLRDGLVIVTGPTGSGKSTTLATIIDQINRCRSCHILTIEDPIEYLHKNQLSLVHQRELYKDVDTFANAVRSAMREDPDVILVGEMRDKETILAAITASETGHLVFTTLHTGDAPGAIDRISGMFPEGEQVALRKQLSMVLKVVVAQRLLPTLDNIGIVPAIEVLWVNSAISHLIRTWDQNQIYSFMESGSAEGMRTMESSLAQLVQSGQIEKELALRMSRDPTILEERLKFNKQVFIKG